MRDERLVSGRLNSYIIFTKERMTNEDFKNIPCPERARLIGKEWKNLSEEEKKVRFLSRPCSSSLLPQLPLMCHTHLFRNTMIWLRKIFSVTDKKRRQCMVLNI